MNPRDHRLFREYPLLGSATTSTGTAPTPYHIYNGYGAFIGGTADLGPIQQLLRKESVTPMQTTGARAFMGIWVCNFTDASLGPHHELQFSFFVSGRRDERIVARPLSLLTLLATRPDVQMLCHGLWNNTARVVAYNRELLSLNACVTLSQIDHAEGAFQFDFKDGASGRAIIAGRLPNPERASLRANWEMMSNIGFRRIWTLYQQPWMGLRILNPTGIGLNRNGVAETFTKNQTIAVRYFCNKTDTLEFGEATYGCVNFKPEFVQYMTGFKFVYLMPK